MGGREGWRKGVTSRSSRMLWDSMLLVRGNRSWWDSRSLVRGSRWKWSTHPIVGWLLRRLVAWRRRRGCSSRRWDCGGEV